MLYYLEQTWIHFKTMLRVPISLFFTLIFAPMMQIVMMTSLGNFELGEGLHFIDKYVLITTGVGVLPLGLITFSLMLVNLHETSHILRMRYFNVTLPQIIVPSMLAHLVTGILGIGLNLAVAALVFHAKVPDFLHLSAYLFQVMVTLVALMSCGAALAFLLKKQNAVMAVSMALMFVSLFLCGGFGGFDNLPDVLRTVSDFIPARYVMIDGFYIWTNKTYFIPELFTTSSLWTVIFGTIAFLGFKSKKISQIFRSRFSQQRKVDQMAKKTFFQKRMNRMVTGMVLGSLTGSILSFLLIRLGYNHAADHSLSQHDVTAFGLPIYKIHEAGGKLAGEVLAGNIAIMSAVAAFLLVILFEFIAIVKYKK